ncbi:VrrA/YqfQ family protein [Pseudogracilibacillus auburnensis]|uniref:YqfQ-like protein n=1 Tax=Pseudogracilibacillus auburnensis TaxID=1494959 RepID=A0A2V3VT87_9BACI|nr:VrrA/YqfQ family protein [Pseudogracilibacillus auburnensis]MBO1004351.1 hypothetical protein [Pseudogracilibacillus auburnensis]PXW85103.1 YqfQ-like protein [Pseudogracilibacillus auburnensis]
MVNQNYHTVFFRPVGYNDYNFTPIGNSNPRLAPFRNRVSYKINEYFLRGLVYIQSILKLLLSSSPFIEQYGPVIKELPKMYTLVKAFKEINNSELEEGIEEQNENDEYMEKNTFRSDESLPKLFI